VLVIQGYAESINRRITMQASLGIK
jgi:hypothetical protein